MAARRTWPRCGSSTPPSPARTARSSSLGERRLLGQTWSRQSLEERGGVRNPGLPRAEQGEQVLQSATEAASRDLALLLQRRLALMARSTAVSGAGVQAAE